MGVKFWETKTAKRNDELFDRYVPSSGKADTLGGEILRAWNRVAYRYLNDGDICGIGYGRETVNPAARWLASKVDGARELEILTTYDDCEPFMTEEKYEEILGKVQDNVIGMLDYNPALLTVPNDEDCITDMKEEWDKELPDEEWEE